jgi:hypothetical protein
MLYIILHPYPPRALEYSVTYQKFGGFTGTCTRDLKLVLLSAHIEGDQNLLKDVKWEKLDLDKLEVYFKVAKEGIYSTIIKTRELGREISEESETFTVEPRDPMPKRSEFIFTSITGYLTLLLILMPLLTQISHCGSES